MTRLDFHKKLCSILGSKQVYFQPPSSQKIYYPAIIYTQAPFDKQYADNFGYILTDHYMVTHITSKADSVVPKTLAAMPYTRQDQAYRSNGLYHTVFSVYV